MKSSDGKAFWYMIDHTLEKYRWVGPIEDEAQWGLKLVRVRMDPVSKDWPPIPVEWLPETAGRAACDFPVFWPGFLCLSRRARSAVDLFLREIGEYIQLDGLAGEYIGYHCLHTLDIVDDIKTAEAIKNHPGIAFASPTFVPTLRADEIQGCGVFRVSQSFQKLFVSHRFRTAYEQAGLTGLEFLKVPLT